MRNRFLIALLVWACVVITYAGMSGAQQALDGQFPVVIEHIEMSAISFGGWLIFAPAIMIVGVPWLLKPATKMTLLVRFLALCVIILTLDIAYYIVALPQFFNLPASQLIADIRLIDWMWNLALTGLFVFVGRQFEHPLSRVENAPKKLVIQDRTRTWKVDVSEILALCADGNYVTVVTRKDSILYRETLSRTMKELGEGGFLRIHRSFAVKLGEIRECSSKPERSVTLKTGHKFPVSRRSFAKVEKLLSDE